MQLKRFTRADALCLLNYAFPDPQKDRVPFEQYSNAELRAALARIFDETTVVFNVKIIRTYQRDEWYTVTVPLTKNAEEDVRQAILRGDVSPYRVGDLDSPLWIDDEFEEIAPVETTVEPDTLPPQWKVECPLCEKVIDVEKPFPANEQEKTILCPTCGTALRLGAKGCATPGGEA